MRSQRLATIFCLAVLLAYTSASAVGFVLQRRNSLDISGTISSTLTITEDSQLVGDVICTVQRAPCIAIGASGISLKLNGFTMTGLADAATGCRGGGQPAATGPEDGISIVNQRGVIIEGPGVVQQFRTQGIRIASSTRVLVTKVTASTNCGSGFFMAAGSDNELEANISVRNGSADFPCGGI